MERAFSHTSSAVSAKLLIDVQLPVNDLRNFIRTCSFDGTFFAALAGLAVKVWNSLSDDSHIVQIWLHTVVRASAYCDLKFMRQCNLAITLIESLKNLLGDPIGIQKSILTGGSLAGYYRSDLCSCSSCLQTFLRNKFLKLFDLFVGDSLDLHGKPGRVGKISVAEFLCCFRHTSVLCRCHLSVYSDHPCRKFIRPPVI